MKIILAEYGTTINQLQDLIKLCEEHKQLKKLAAEKGVSMKELILTLIKEVRKYDERKN